MKTIRFAPLALAAALALAARADEHHWGYEGEHGPEHWGEIAEACKAGKQQSPIDIHTKGKAAAKRSKDLPRIGFQWAKSKGELVNNGHTIQINVKPGNSIDVGGTRYELAQFHFHTPSEHLMDGHHTGLEVHFVHKTADGKLGVVGILIDEIGAANRALQGVLKSIEKPGEIDVDLPALLPKGHAYFTYPGSLTTPPCSEGVHWMVLKDRLHTSAANVKAFKKIFPHNARPEQPLNDRAVEAASP